MKINTEKSTKVSALPRGVKGIHKVIDVLDILGAYPSGLTLAELCNHLQLPKSTVHRILNVLLDREYVRETFEKGRYALGIEIMRLSKACQAGLNFFQEARPLLIELNRMIDENVTLAILDKPCHRVIYLDKVDSSKAIRLASHIGEIAPVHCTALGKALLSGFRDKELLEVLSNYELKRFTDRTITDLEVFVTEINEVRKQGYSVDLQEYRSGVVCVAALINSESEKPLAAVGVSAPAVRLKQSRLEYVERSVVETAKKISEIIVHVPMPGAWE
jgi:IclR family transcriptional regulator, KDG regulon repressor